jgi:hypothetical protein
VSQIEITTTDLARMILFSAAGTGRVRLAPNILKEMLPPISKERRISGPYFLPAERARMVDVDAIWAKICEQAGARFNRFSIEFVPEEIIDKDWPNAAGPTARHSFCFLQVIMFFSRAK